MSGPASATHSLRALTLYFLRLGTIGFGGPVALVGYMHRDLVERRKWITDDDYKEGLALSQLAPGPLAAQLAIYIGYVHHRVLGATLAGLAFVIPSFVMVIGISVAYTHFGGLPWMRAVFYGVGAAVIGIIAVSSFKLTRKSLGRDAWLWVLFGITAVVTIVTQREEVMLVLGAGIVYWMVKAPPKALMGASHALVPGLLLASAAPEGAVLWQIAVFFAKAGAFVFGSGLAIVPFLYGGVVKDFGWLTEAQFVDAVAVAMITPGPIVITVAFIGYLVAGFPGACVAALATFLPCYLFTVLPAPYFKKYGRRPGIKAFVDGVTASAVGAIAGAVVVLGMRSLVDVPTALIAVAAAAVLWYVKRIQEPLIILAAALIGLMLMG